MQMAGKFLIFFLVSPQDSSQIELLKELMDLQKDMVVMLLSMLEGRFAFLTTPVGNLKARMVD